MKKLSLKMKLTLAYTLLMTLVVCCILFLLFAIGNQQILSSVQQRLRISVYDAVGDLDYDEGILEFDSDIGDLEYGVYLSVYASDGTWLYGRVPQGFSNTQPFEDGNLRMVRENGRDYAVMDSYAAIEGYGNVYIRGVASVSAAEEGVFVIRNIALVFLPLLVAVTAVLGYFLIRRTLRPVRLMTETVQEICRDNDLSRRVALGSGSDEIYRLAQTFDNMLDQIETGFKRERQFTSDVSHELRTPVAAMLLECEELLHDAQLDDSARAGVEFLYQKVNYLSSMIAQLLLLSRADQGRQTLVMENVDLSELMEMAALEAEEMAKAKEITVSLEAADGLCVWGDETLLIRMVMNLLENAVNYGKPGGHIGIRLWAENQTVHGSIKDDGIGIAPEQLAHIWERFYQADPARSAPNSSGLGLSMVAWIIEAHHGQIFAKSTPGQGSCFTFVLPARIDFCKNTDYNS